MDLAKISNCIELSNDLKEYIKNYSYPYKKKHAKLITLPTTAGSGADCNYNAVIYLDGIKYYFESEFLNNIVSKKCIKKKSITDILDAYIILDCDDLS